MQKVLTISPYCFVDFVGDVFEHLSRKLHPHADVHLIVNELESEPEALAREPFGPRPPRSHYQIFAKESAAFPGTVQHMKGKGFVPVTVYRLHARIEEHVNPWLQKFVHPLQDLEIVLRA
jgi:hypothetical protein